VSSVLHSCNVKTKICVTRPQCGKENIKNSPKETLGLHELKQHKPWFDEECSRFLDKGEQAKK
jgi:hypothetical protein